MEASYDVCECMCVCVLVCLPACLFVYTCTANPVISKSKVKIIVPREEKLPINMSCYILLLKSHCRNTSSCATPLCRWWWWCPLYLSAQWWWKECPGHWVSEGGMIVTGWQWPQCGGQQGGGHAEEQGQVNVLDDSVLHLVHGFIMFCWPVLVLASNSTK